eukprot:TRINITY_DN257_c0_g1_i2.p1 TRINITY_DN257_c0_g1~~TRINITY_DN257_c0_g1_i2.p1  ORF type:complete len:245 (+),score=-28.55 TRINITY_DN257_c0_g1_i2:89-736(+)
MTIYKINKQNKINILYIFIRIYIHFNMFYNILNIFQYILFSFCLFLHIQYFKYAQFYNFFNLILYILFNIINICTQTLRPYNAYIRYPGRYYIYAFYNNIASFKFKYIKYQDQQNKIELFTQQQVHVSLKNVYPITQHKLPRYSIANLKFPIPQNNTPQLNKFDHFLLPIFTPSQQVHNLKILSTCLIKSSNKGINRYECHQIRPQQYNNKLSTP